MNVPYPTHAFRMLSNSARALMLAGLFVGSASQSLSAWADTIPWYTLGRQAQIDGPTLAAEPDATELTAYHQELFRVIFEEAHQRAQSFLEEGDSRTYWAFILGSFAVPYHESKLRHFRISDRPETQCQASANSGGTLKKHNTLLWRVFDKHLVRRGITPPCTSFAHSRSAIQLIGSRDLYSVGILQLALNWHEAGYIATGKYLSVRDSLNYGLRYYFDGFERIFRDAAKYPCLRLANTSAPKSPPANADPVNYTSLIRGAWAGQFNGGSVAGTCRFTDKSNRWHANDKGFAGDLETLLAGESTFHQYLPEHSSERSALNEIIENFAKRTNIRIQTTALLMNRSSDSLRSPRASR